MLRVLSIDDHSIFRLGLVRLLSSDPRFAEVVGVPDAPSAQRWLSEHTADLILLDLALGRGSGLDLLDDLRRRGRPERVVVVTMFKGSLHRNKALELGAWDFISKDEEPGVLVERISAAATATRPPQQTQADPLDSLSPRQIDVLRLLGQGLSTREVAERLMISPKTVESHRLNLKSLLGVSHVGALVATAARLFPATE